MLVYARIIFNMVLDVRNRNIPAFAYTACKTKLYASMCSANTIILKVRSIIALNFTVFGHRISIASKSKQWLVYCKQKKNVTQHQTTKTKQERARMKEVK